MHDYLNDICVYLEEENKFLIDNIQNIARLNDAFVSFMEKKKIHNETKSKHLTFEEIYILSREIIEQIDKNYLNDFDRLLASGELDFGYENEYRDSNCTFINCENEIKKIININRQFNYDDVCDLIHEFIHYENNRRLNSLSEFLAIYFDIFATDFLLQRGISKEEIDYNKRLKIAYNHAKVLFNYEIVLEAFVTFGNLDENTKSLLNQYMGVFKNFDGECKQLYNHLYKVEDLNKEKIKRNPEKRGKYLSASFINYNYQYVLGTMLAIYARKYCKFEDIVYLNNHVSEQDKSVEDICLSIGIDFYNPNFKNQLFSALDEYIEEFNEQKDKVI